MDNQKAVAADQYVLVKAMIGKCRCHHIGLFYYLPLAILIMLEML